MLYRYKKRWYVQRKSYGHRWDNEGRYDRDIIRIVDTDQEGRDYIARVTRHLKPYGWSLTAHIDPKTEQIYEFTLVEFTEEIPVDEIAHQRQRSLAGLSEGT